MKRFKTISEFHAFRDLPAPQHPLISVLNVETVQHLRGEEPTALLFDFYGIGLKRVANLRAKYGQQAFDFDKGLMSFMAPGQVATLGLARKE